MLARISNGKWIAGFTTTIHAGESSAFLCQADETPYDSPTQVPAWTVYSGSAWEEQETLRVEAPLLKEEIGVRVRRGPSWTWGDQDGGPGSAGVTIPCPRTNKTNGWVCVRWDSGKEFEYRVGKWGAYDLIVVEQGRRSLSSAASSAPSPRPSPRSSQQGALAGGQALLGALGGGLLGGAVACAIESGHESQGRRSLSSAASSAPSPRPSPRSSQQGALAGGQALLEALGGGLPVESGHESQGVVVHSGSRVVTSVYRVLLSKNRSVDFGKVEQGQLEVHCAIALNTCTDKPQMHMGLVFEAPHREITASFKRSSWRQVLVHRLPSGFKVDLADCTDSFAEQLKAPVAANLFTAFPVGHAQRHHLGLVAKVMDHDLKRIFQIKDIPASHMNQYTNCTVIVIRQLKALGIQVDTQQIMSTALQLGCSGPVADGICADWGFEWGRVV